MRRYGQLGDTQIALAGGGDQLQVEVEVATEPFEFNGLQQVTADDEVSLNGNR